MIDTKRTLPDLQSMTRQQLLELKLLVNEEINAIKSQLEAAKTTQHQTGEYANPDWFRRANSALRIKQMQIQKIQLLLSSRREISLPALFMSVCEEKLDPAVFSSLKAQAVARLADEKTA